MMLFSMHKRALTIYKAYSQYAVRIIKQNQSFIIERS